MNNLQIIRLINTMIDNTRNASIGNKISYINRVFNN